MPTVSSVWLTSHVPWPWKHLIHSTNDSVTVMAGCGCMHPFISRLLSGGKECAVSAWMASDTGSAQTEDSQLMCCRFDLVHPFRPHVSVTSKTQCGHMPHGISCGLSYDSYVNAIKPVAQPDPKRHMAEKWVRSVQHPAENIILYLPFWLRTTARSWLMPVETRLGDGIWHIGSESKVARAG